MHAPGRLAAALTAATLGLAACGGAAPQAAPTPAVTKAESPAPDGLTAFADCAGLERHMQDLTAPHVTKFGLDNGKVVAQVVGDGPRSPIGRSTAVWPADFHSQGAPLTTSAANTAETAKTDGRILVALQGRSLHVVDVSSGKPVRLSSLPLPGQWADGLLLDGSRVLILGTLWDPEDASLGGPMPGPGEPGFFAQHSIALTLVDIADPKHPTVVSSEHILGDRIGAWLDGGKARVVVASHPGLRVVAAQPSAEAAKVAQNKEIFGASPAAAWLPHRRILDAAGATVSEGPLLDCADVLHPDTDSGASLTSVIALDLARADAFSAADSTAVVATGAFTHVAPGSLYLAVTAGGWGAADGEAVSAARAEAAAPTAIHAFAVRGAAPRYLGHADLTGYLAGPPSMSARDGDLRVAVHAEQPWRYGEAGPPGSRTRIGVLRERGGQLATVGTVDVGRVPIEVYSGRPAVHWMGDRAVVTSSAGASRLVDLTRPSRPVVRGAFPGLKPGTQLVSTRSGQVLGIEEVPTGRSSDRTGDRVQATSYDVLGGGAPTASATSNVFRGFGPGEITYLPGPGLALLIDSTRLVSGDCPTGSYCTARGRLVRPECRPITVCPKLRRPVHEHGVLGLRTAADGTVQQGAWWSGNHATSVLSLGDRLAIVYDSGVALVDPDTLRPLGAVVLPSAPRI